MNVKKIAMIIIGVIVISALICTTLITMSIGAAAAVDTAFVMAGITGIVSLGRDDKGDKDGKN